MFIVVEMRSSMPLGPAARWRGLWNGSGTVSALGHVAQPSTSRLTFASPLTATAGQDLVSGGVQRGLVLIARERALGHDHDRPFCQSTFSEHLGNSSGTVDVETGDVNRVVGLEQDVNMARTWLGVAGPVGLVTPERQYGLVVRPGSDTSPRRPGTVPAGGETGGPQSFTLNFRRFQAGRVPAASQRTSDVTLVTQIAAGPTAHRSIPALCLPLDSFGAWPSWTDR
jgi:hypothetical protein